MENPEGKTLRQVLAEKPQRLTPTGLLMAEDDESDNDLRRRIQSEQADQRPAGKTSFKSFIDQTEGMREANRRAKIRSRR